MRDHICMAEGTGRNFPRDVIGQRIEVIVRVKSVKVTRGTWTFQPLNRV